jgi:hypothetical protein
MSKLTPEMREAIRNRLSNIPESLNKEDLRKVLCTIWISPETYEDLKIVQDYFPQYTRKSVNLYSEAITKFVEDLVDKMLQDLNEVDEALKESSKAKLKTR